MAAAPEPATGRWPPTARLHAGPGGDDVATRISTPDLIADVAADVSGIVRGEMLLGRAETAGNLHTLVGAGVRFGAALLMLGLAVSFATVALVVAIAAWVGLLWALLLMTGLCALAAAVLVMVARRSLRGWSLLPERTLGRVVTDLDRAAERRSSRSDRHREREEAGNHA